MLGIQALIQVHKYTAYMYTLASQSSISNAQAQQVAKHTRIMLTSQKPHHDVPYVIPSVTGILLIFAN